MNNNLYDRQNIVLRELLIDLRNEAQLTQKELSKQLGKPQSYVSKYESGERKLTLVEIRNIILCCNSTLKSFVASFEEELKLIAD